MEKLSDYKERREALLQEVSNLKYEGLTFSDKEIKANNLFYQEVVPTFTFPEDFYSELAMKYKQDIENHPFFNALGEMPKGTLLHHHMTDCIDVKWMSKTVQEHEEKIYQRAFQPSKYPNRLMYTTKPHADDKKVKEVLSEELNEGETLDEFFLRKLSMLPHELAEVKNNSGAWGVFMPKYFYCLPLLQYKVFYKQHLMNTFKQCVNDKVYRLESRLTPNRLTDEEMNFITIEEEMQIYRDCLEKIQEQYPVFSFGIVIEIVKIWPEQRRNEIITLAIKLKISYPDLIIGIDLDGDEDNFASLQQLTEVMLKVEELAKQNNIDLPWILHCGESVKVKNQNPIDAYLHKAHRLGHGINLFKHSYLLNRLKEDKVCIEINIVSNQTLKNVRDLRMHPAISYLNMGLKICLNNDDPTLYNTQGVLYDFFIATVCCEFNLFDLKKICKDSIECCEAKLEDKTKMLKKFTDDWDNFIQYFINKFEPSENKQ